jgi:hypothetical protein
MKGIDELWYRLAKRFYVSLAVDVWYVTLEGF